MAENEHNSRIASLCRVFQELSAEIGVPYLSIFDALLHSPSWMKEVINGDGAHPQTEGYTTLAHLVQYWPAWWFTD